MFQAGLRTGLTDEYVAVYIFFDVHTLGALNNYTFLVVAFCNSLISIISEIQSKRTLEKMNIITTASYKVLRDYNEIELPSDELVVGDHLYLTLGNQVPVDGVIVDGFAEFNESLLTGESDAIKKTVGDKIYAGSYLVSGNVLIVAEVVGDDRYASKIQQKAQNTKTHKTELVRAINRIIHVGLIFTVPLGVLNLLKYIFMTPDPIEHTAYILSPIIDMIPCGMLLLTSLALSTGIIKLARKNTLVQDLYSIEMLARVDTLCFDKTGTITDGSMSVESILKLNYEIDIEAALNSYIECTGANTPTSKAIISHFNRSSLNEKVVNTIPFSSAKKYDAVEFENSGTFILGAPEFIEAACKRSIITEDIADFIARENNLAHRTLMLAHTYEHIKDDALFKKAEPIAIISLKDNIRKNVKETLDWFYDNGVDVKIISGDNLVTVQKISELAGVRNFESAVSLDGMSDDQIRQLATKTTIFARVSPDQKALIIQTLKESGKTVGVTGDGVNDILAMKTSDCGIAMGEGSDAARSAANIVLLDSNFENMPAVVEEGRRVINNVQRSSTVFVMKTILVGLVTLISIILPISIGYPFIHQNLDGISMVVAGLGSFLLTMEPHSQKISGRFLRNIMRTAIPAGLFLSIAVGTPYLLSLWGLTYIPKTIAIIGMNVAALLVFWNICKPVNGYRFMSSMVVTLVGAVALIVPALIPGSESYFYIITASDVSNFTRFDVLMITSAVLIAYEIYNIILNFISRFIRTSEK